MGMQERHRLYPLQRSGLPRLAILGQAIDGLLVFCAVGLGEGRERDNAIVIGLAAAGLPAEQRAKVIMIGIAAATVLRIGLAGMTVQLLQLVGLMLAGGILLLWVCWKMWRELRTPAVETVEVEEALSGIDINADGTIAAHALQKSFMQATGADHHRRRSHVAR